jgi:hypothetical protein
MSLRLAGLDTRIAVLTWIIGALVAANVTVLFKIWKLV